MAGAPFPGLYKPGVIVYTGNPSAEEVEIGESIQVCTYKQQVWGKPGLPEILSKKKQKITALKNDGDQQ